MDWTANVGSKWKQFFQELEIHHGLDADQDSHIWLLHHLFLPVINSDALHWANTWNTHTMRLPDQHSDSPHALRYFSIIESGTRGIDENGNVLPAFEPIADDLDPDQVHEYGIDWEALDDNQILQHHVGHNHPDHLTNNPFVAHWPEEYHVVEVLEPNCPFSQEQVAWLDQALQGFPVETMDQCQTIWAYALNLSLHLGGHQA